MLPRSVAALATVVLISLCFGAAPVASISSTQPIVVSGISVPTDRVMSWPVADNDEIVTKTAPATVRFTDGSTVTLQRNSRMRLQPGPSGVEVIMLAGSAVYDLKARSSVAVANPAGGARTVQAVASAPRGPVPLPRASSAAPATGVVFAPSMFSAASFAPSINRHGNPAGAKNMITLPNGLVLFVNPIVSGGAITGYTIVGVGADTANGGIVPTPAVINLDGYTISVVNGASGAGQIKIFAPGSGTPLSDAAAASLLQSALTNVNVNLPPGQQISTTTPGISIQPFSVSGT